MPIFLITTQSKVSQLPAPHTCATWMAVIEIIQRQYWRWSDCMPFYCSVCIRRFDVLCHFERGVKGHDLDGRPKSSKLNYTFYSSFFYILSRTCLLLHSISTETSTKKITRWKLSLNYIYWPKYNLLLQTWSLIFTMGRACFNWHKVHLSRDERTE